MPKLEEAVRRRCGGVAQGLVMVKRKPGREMRGRGLHDRRKSGHLTESRGACTSTTPIVAETQPDILPSLEHSRRNLCATPTGRLVMCLLGVGTC